MTFRIVTATALVLISVLWLGADAATGESSAPLGQGDGSRRIGGADRYATSAVLLEDMARYRPESDDGKLNGVVVARGDHFADALSASTGSHALGSSPFALTPTAALDSHVEQALANHARTDPFFHVGIMGDTDVVSEHVEQQLVDLGGRIMFRLAGADRYETAAMAVERVYDLLEREHGTSPDFEILLTSGVNFPDGLAAAPLVLSGHHNALLMLTTPDRLHPDAHRVIERGARRVTILGGTQAVSQAVEDQVARIVPVDRIGGADRTETAALLASRLFDDLKDGGFDTVSVALARGDDFPDALGAGIWAGYMSQQPLLLTESPTELGDAAGGWLEDHADAIDQVVVIGGKDAVSEDVFAEAREAATVSR